MIAQDSISPATISMVDCMSALVVPGAKLLPTTTYGPAAPLILNSFEIAAFPPFQLLLRLEVGLDAKGLCLGPRSFLIWLASRFRAAWNFGLVTGEEECAR